MHDRQLNVAWGDPFLLEVFTSVSTQFNDFSYKVYAIIYELFQGLKVFDCHSSQPTS